MLVRPDGRSEPGTDKGLERVRVSLSRLMGVQVAVTYKNDDGASRVLQTVLFSHFDHPPFRAW